ncbi:hypothetical protein GCM10007877_08200 [Marinibactrum halimedae]|uniref:Xaa-Pro dipeptidyl-peptidase C-terminal domain-containing protein n=2 Tax=Marinibactrum halimedae TaxID=1444977 RepID=A0AA37T7F2_9GAMM|nr:hypothetical protein GCM10007877_08200 [Marinibactrum halimedae]
MLTVTLWMTLVSTQAIAICINIDIPDTPLYTFDDEGIFIQTHDGLELDANIFIPTGASEEDKRPAIIFINSWALNDNEYLAPAKRFAEKGYVVFSYTTRGFGCSEGKVSVVTDDDMSDLSSAVDYLDSLGFVDIDNIGASGISYGSGISLVGLAKEPRIKTVAAMSTWDSIVDSIYKDNTTRLAWGAVLVLSGEVIGNLDNEVRKVYTSILTNKNIDYVREWSAKRSPRSYIDLINERNAPVFIANNYGDGLFPPNGAMALYSKLTTPKHLELNQGEHATGELDGLLGLDSFTWTNAENWFDYWLKGDTSLNIPNERVFIETDLNKKREVYSQLPDEIADTQTFYLTPSGLLRDGSLSEQPYQGRETSNRIMAGIDSGAWSGIPILASIFDGNLGEPVTMRRLLFNSLAGQWYESPTLTQGMRIRGIPKLDLEVSSNTDHFQVVTYLYDIAPNGLATLINYAPYSRHDLERGENVQFTMELTAAAYDIPAGHKLAVVIDTFDLLFTPPSILPYSLNFHYSREFQPKIEIPVL